MDANMSLLTGKISRTCYIWLFISKKSKSYDRLTNYYACYRFFKYLWGTTINLKARVIAEEYKAIQMPLLHLERAYYKGIS